MKAYTGGGKVVMSNEAVLLECWRELPPEDQERVVKFAQSLKLQTESAFVAQTLLGNKLWRILSGAHEENAVTH